MADESFLEFLNRIEKRVTEYIFRNYEEKQTFKPEILDRCVTSYLRGGGKRLRPAVTIMACGAVGGDEEVAVPVAASIELYHTWTLIHDDLIDDDHLRRGNSTVHFEAKNWALDELEHSEDQAVKYGQDIAVLAGDVQHGWAISMLTDKPLIEQVDANVIFKLINTVQTVVLGTLVHGEIMDVEYGLKHGVILDISEDDIVNMLWMKTGVLYEFAGLAGAMIGKNTTDTEDTEIVAIKNFCSNCGTAFQLKDDILGILGKRMKLGKPVGSDIREGKKTTIVRTALANANEEQGEIIRGVLGKSNASEDEINAVTELLVDLGGVEKTQELAVQYVEKALKFLDDLRDSKYKALFEGWAYYLIERNY